MPGMQLQVKFDYLYALSVAKTQGQQEYLEELEAIVDNYPGTEIATLAAFTLQHLTKEDLPDDVDLSMYSENTDGPQYYVITGLTEDVAKVEEELSDYNSKFFPGRTFLIKSIIMGDRQMIYIKPFADKSLAMSYHKEMKGNLSFLSAAGLSEYKMYCITEENFKTLVKSKDEDTYLLFFNRYYPFEL